MCEHRHLIVVGDRNNAPASPDDDNLGDYVEVLAFDSCTAVAQFIEEQVLGTEKIVLDATAARVGHFHQWIKKAGGE